MDDDSTYEPTIEDVMDRLTRIEEKLDKLQVIGEVFHSFGAALDNGGGSALMKMLMR
jgi:tetrahydromethanopterin S-methyltransferase subunit G